MGDAERNDSLMIYIGRDVFNIINKLNIQWFKSTKSCGI